MVKKKKTKVTEAMPAGMTPEFLKDIQRHLAMGRPFSAGRLTREQARAIMLDSRSRQAIAQVYGISIESVIKIKRRLRWASATWDLPSVGCSIRNNRSGQTAPNAKLTDAEVRQIFLDKRSYPVIAAQYAVSRKTIEYIKQRAWWRKVTLGLPDPLPWWERRAYLGETKPHAQQWK